MHIRDFLGLSDENLKKLQELNCSIFEFDKWSLDDPGFEKLCDNISKCQNLQKFFLDDSITSLDDDRLQRFLFSVFNTVTYLEILSLTVGYLNPDHHKILFAYFPKIYLKHLDLRGYDGFFKLNDVSFKNILDSIFGIKNLGKLGFPVNKLSAYSNDTQLKIFYDVFSKSNLILTEDSFDDERTKSYISKIGGPINNDFLKRLQKIKDINEKQKILSLLPGADDKKSLTFLAAKKIAENSDFNSTNENPKFNTNKLTLDLKPEINEAQKVLSPGKEEVPFDKAPPKPGK